jgi:hypothetical protein
MGNATSGIKLGREDDEQTLRNDYATHSANRKKYTEIINNLNLNTDDNLVKQFAIYKKRFDTLEKTLADLQNAHNACENGLGTSGVDECDAYRKQVDKAMQENADFIQINNKMDSNINRKIREIELQKKPPATVTPPTLSSLDTVASLLSPSTSSTKNTLPFDTMRALINKYTLQFYNGTATILDETGINKTDVDFTLTDLKDRLTAFNCNKSNRTYADYHDVPQTMQTLIDNFTMDVIRHPIEVLCCLNALNATKPTKFNFDGTKFLDIPNATTDEDKFYNVLIYYINLNKIWQNAINMVRNPATSGTPSLKPSTDALYKYVRTPLGQSNLNVIDFKPWNQITNYGFPTNPNIFPFGGNLFPQGMVMQQRGGNGGTCGYAIKQVVDSVLNANGADEGIRKQINDKLNESIKYETLINQKLQQILSASQSGNGLVGADVAKHLDELNKLIDFLKVNQGALFNTLRLTSLPNTVKHRNLGDMIGGNGDDVLELVKRIAKKVGVV